MPVEPQRTPIEAVRIELYVPVASFRDPMFPGVSRCLAVPPPSTVRGMFAAATGNPTEPIVFGMAACADGGGVDAETYHPIAADGSNPAVRGRVREGKGGMTLRERPFLAGVRVTLWIPEPDGGRIARALRRPVWGLRLGRSQDLVYVRSISSVTLYPAERAVVGHALAPVGGHASPRATVLRLADHVSLDRLRSTYSDYLWCAEPGGWETVRGAYRDGDQAVWLHAIDPLHEETTELMQVLAKSTAHSPLGRPETLTEHSLQVRRAADDLAERIGSPGLLAKWPGFWAWVRAAALLHDAGKVAEGFQRRLRPRGELWGERHEVLSLAFVHLLTRSLPERDQQMIAAGVVFHHRALTGEDGLTRMYPPDADWAAKFGRQVPISRRAAALAWFARELGVEVPADDRKLWELARDAFGQVRIRWSGEVTPEEGLQAVLLQGAVVLADRSASAHVPLHTRMPLPNRYVTSLARPYPHQVKASEHIGHLIVRAPTGSGKTETGLSWASRQLDDMPGHPRLIWLLPYRASIDAARLRFIEDLGAEPGEIAILHSTAAQSLLAECTGDDGPAGREHARKARAQRAAMRLFAQRVRVATPHQLLRAALAGPAHSAGLIEQANALMVLDELHAYDPVVFGRICAAMRLWARLGSRVCVLSATLARPMVDLVRESLGPSPVEIVDAPPGVAPDRHRLVLDEEAIDSPASLDRIRRWLAEGHGVLVVANTVARAQRLYQALRSAALEAHPGDEDAAILLHSRFRHKDRDAIEKRIRQRYPERDEHGGERRGGLVVATQALEVSLCLDFDRGVSELAPVEAIAQRAGRVNRRGRHPDGVVEFRVHLDVEAWPYEQAALDAARLALTEHPGPIISEQTIDAWLKTAYATEWGREWETRARQSRDTFGRAFLTFTTPFHDRAEFADKLARELDSVEVLHHEDLDRYRELEAEDPLLAHRLLIPMRYGSAMRYGTYNRRLRLFEIAMPYSPETGLSLPAKQAKGETKVTPPAETIF
jgi:CRISPR-associated endonuclease/helicase Cas3